MQPCSNSTMLQLILNNTINMNMNNLTDDLVSSVRQPTHLRWGMLSLVLVIICAASGNLLVCMAVCWERRLQNMTNYFLMSLAIADFLVSIVVMPLGMVVEIFGFFPMSAHMCIFWVTTDVLMCTASIWHMSTMSMDRFFTLKYPMRYGRNKTKRMVCVKILFVWLVSIAVSCPVGIAGLLDTRTVFNDGQCVPTIPTFLISGSVFAFYIPLLIMIVTYALTIQILWENQNLMTRIEKLDKRASEKAIPEKKEYSITSRSQPETTPETRNRTAMSETDGPDTNVVGISEIGQVEIPQALIRHHEMRAARAHWTQCDSVRSSFDSAQTTITTCTLGSEQGTSIAPSRTGSESFPPLIDPHKMRRKSLQLPLQRRRCSKVHFERVPSADTVKEPTPVPLYPSKSYSHLMEINQWNVSSLVKGSHYHSYHGLNNNLGLDPKRSYDHLPDDVFPCLIGLVDEDEDENDDVFEAGDEAAHCRSIQNPVIPLRVSVSSIDETVSEKDEEVDSQVKVETKIDANPPKPSPPTTTTTTKSTPEKNLGKQPVAYNGNIPNGNISNGNIPNGIKETLLKKNYHNKVTRTFRNFLKAHLRRANEKPKIKKAFRHLLSNKTASNEKKALKVLGIIFAVFVVLWTPFFIVNIISATCTDCMSNVTPEMMSIFLWMGYVASLANPLIYTMFNTSFRRAFVKILTCKYQTPRVYNESSCLSFAASWHFDRRNTIMMYLKEEMANN